MRLNGEASQPELSRRLSTVVLYDKRPAHGYAGWLRSFVASTQQIPFGGFFLVIPFAWASHWKVQAWGHGTAFTLCFISLIPLQAALERWADDISHTLALGLYEVFSITLKNLVEMVLAAILLKNCHLRLLQSSVIGLIILHLLLVPGWSFLCKGRNNMSQILKPHRASDNSMLLMTGVLSLMLPTAFFAAQDRGSGNDNFGGPLVNDDVRHGLLVMSRGIAVMLLLTYIVSRLYRSPSLSARRFYREEQDVEPEWERECPTMNGPDRPGRTHGAAQYSPGTPFEVSPEALTTGPLGQETSPHPLVTTVLLIIVVAIVAVTAEFLVESIDPLRERNHIQTEWFGLFLLPLVSFLPEATAEMYLYATSLIKNMLWQIRTKLPLIYQSSLSSSPTTTQPWYKPSPVFSPFSGAQPIDQSIQFTLAWLPLLVLVAWCTGKPLHLLFDFFEVAMLLGTCFLVSYVTGGDKSMGKKEGMAMISFYIIMAIATWFYPGQPEVGYMLNCPGSVAEAVASGVQNA
ncbi:hypothetical protein BC628DRAFT_1396303 [Trametes gibbosa]|nr:hypothetical protein BC628DRAFT_1396303 [Trametes gibbosa]